MTIDNWITSGIIEMMSKRDKFFKKWKLSERLRQSEEVTNDLKDKYKQMRNRTRYAIRKAKVNFSYNKVNEYSMDSKSYGNS